MSIERLPDELSDELQHHFDQTSELYQGNLDESNRMLRQCPVVHSDQFGGFQVVSRHSEVVSVLKNHAVFSSASGIRIPPGAQTVPAIPVESDDPMHAVYRYILWPFLTPLAVSKLETFVRDTAVALIDRVLDRGRMDVREEFARPLPAAVISEFFGMSLEGVDQCYRWINIFVVEYIEHPEVADRAIAEFYEYLEELLDKARATPGDTVIHAMASDTAIGGRPLSRDEAVGLLFTSIIGAFETTVSTLALGVYRFGRHPDQRARLIADPSLMPGAVEEVLRIDPAIAGLGRHALAEFDVPKVEPGDWVFTLTRANHDETVFSDPESFDVQRTNNRHLTFGHGIHKCVGQHLARLELRVGFEELLRRIPNYVVEGDPRPGIRGGGTWGFEELHISWER